MELLDLCESGIDMSALALDTTLCTSGKHPGEVDNQAILSLTIVRATINLKR